MPFPLSAHRLHARPPLLYMRAWNQRIRESARLFRGMCSHAWYRESYGERQSLSLCFACRPHSLATHDFLRLSRVCGRSLKEEALPLFVLFVLFGQAKSTLCFMYFCMTKSTKSQLRRSLLEISPPFPALPKREQYIPSCANISSEPSDRGQKQECRLKCTGCLLDFALCHADTAGVHAFSSVSVQSSCTPATPLYAGVEPAHTRLSRREYCVASECGQWTKQKSQVCLSP